MSTRKLRYVASAPTGEVRENEGGGEGGRGGDASFPPSRGVGEGGVASFLPTREPASLALGVRAMAWCAEGGGAEAARERRAR